MHNGWCGEVPGKYAPGSHHAHFPASFNDDRAVGVAAIRLIMMLVATGKALLFGG